MPKNSTTKFADGFPYLICNEASINSLTEKVNEIKLQRKRDIIKAHQF